MIKRLLPLQIISVILFGTMLFSGQTCSQTITIYHNNFALFQEEQSVTLPAGTTWHWVQNLPETIDLHSIILRPDETGNLRILEQKIISPAKERELPLQSAVGKRVEIIFPEEHSLEGILKAVHPSMLSVADNDGRLHLVNRSMILRLIVPHDSLASKNSFAAGWRLASKSSGTFQFDLSYIFSGISWHAEYIGIYNDESRMMKFMPRASIANVTDTKIETRMIRLVAGDVRRNVYMPHPQPGRLMKSMAADAELAASGISREELYEYHVYQISDAVSIDPQSTIIKDLMEPKQISVKKKYIYDGTGKGKAVHVQLLFINNRKEGIGEPLPRGAVTLYQEDEDNLFTLLSEDNLPSTAENQEVKISGGISFDITGERRRTEFRRTSKTTREETYQIKLRNASSRTDTVHVIEHMQGNWIISKESHSYRRIDSHTVEFPVIVNKKSETILTYTVKIS